VVLNKLDAEAEIKEDDGGDNDINRVQNSSGAHPASYPMGTRGSFVGGKAAEA